MKGESAGAEGAREITTSVDERREFARPGRFETVVTATHRAAWRVAGLHGDARRSESGGAEGAREITTSVDERREFARPGRFELPTPGSVDRCSIQLSYGRLEKGATHSTCPLCGVQLGEPPHRGFFSSHAARRTLREGGVRQVGRRVTLCRPY